MPILVQDIVNRVASSVDGEGSQYYLFDQDYLPAIRQAQDFVVGVINSQLGKKKFSEEIFSELTYAQVWQASSFSRITITNTGLPLPYLYQIWTIVDVIPLPTTYPAFTPTAVASPNYSILRTDLSHIESEYYAQRMSAEEWEKNKRNPFAQGHTPEAGEQSRSFAYLNLTNYDSSNYNLQPPFSVAYRPQEIEIRPSVANLPVTIKYIKLPTPPNLITDSLEFPAFVMEIIVGATANFISYKQADGTTLNELSGKLLSLLFSENT